ncbi:MAG TPA: porin family protein [Adhaeribacter sp.]|nr:porin family protein [Adhaeribacter sp.]
MKKSLLLILAVFAFTYANAQGFRIGVKGGGNYSGLNGADSDQAELYYGNQRFAGEAKYKYGYHIGLTTLYEFDDFWGIKTDVLYTTKGFQIEGSTSSTDPGNPGGTVNQETKRTFNYFSVPVLLHINTGNLFFEFGPEISYMAASHGEIKRDEKRANGETIDNSKFKEEKQISKEDLSSTDVGMAFGLGYMTDGGLGIGLRYSTGFTSIYPDDKAGPEEPIVKNSTFMLSLSYMFGGGN